MSHFRLHPESRAGPSQSPGLDDQDGASASAIASLGSSFKTAESQIMSLCLAPSAVVRTRVLAVACQAQRAWLFSCLSDLICSSALAPCPPAPSASLSALSFPGYLHRLCPAALEKLSLNLQPQPVLPGTVDSSCH